MLALLCHSAPALLSYATLLRFCYDSATLYDSTLFYTTRLRLALRRCYFGRHAAAADDRSACARLGKGHDPDPRWLAGWRVGDRGCAAGQGAARSGCVHACACLRACAPPVLPLLFFYRRGPPPDERGGGGGEGQPAQHAMQSMPGGRDETATGAGAGRDDWQRMCTQGGGGGPADRRAGCTGAAPGRKRGAVQHTKPLCLGKSTRLSTRTSTRFAHRRRGTNAEEGRGGREGRRAGGQEDERTRGQEDKRAGDSARDHAKTVVRRLRIDATQGCAQVSASELSTRAERTGGKKGGRGGAGAGAGAGPGSAANARQQRGPPAGHLSARLRLASLGPRQRSAGQAQEAASVGCHSLSWMNGGQRDTTHHGRQRIEGR